MPVRKTVRVKLDRPEKSESRKITLILPRPIDIRLSTLAAVRLVNRSTLAASILGEYLRGVSIEVPDVKAG